MNIVFYTLIRKRKKVLGDILGAEESFMYYTLFLNLGKSYV